jgi:hypothetical protein
VAIVHASATIRPTKPELIEIVLGGPGEVLGSYRFDDPAGEVGVESFVVVDGRGRLQQLVFTYRSAPLRDEGARLVSTMEHSVLGERWVYDGATDPVALECFRRALLGQQDQAVLEVWEDGRPAGTREPSVRLSVAPGTTPDDAPLRIVRDLEDDPAQRETGPALVARWADGEAVVARLVG